MKMVRNKQGNIKKLIFIRHAKAEDQVEEITDFERSLTLRGKSQSKLMAQLLASKEKGLGLVITSPAFRAIETAMIFGKEFKINPDSLKICSDLYSMFERNSYIAFFSSQSDETDTITLFGHNPLISAMPAFFSADETEDLPKSGVLCLTFQAESWSSLKQAGGKIKYFLTPKSLV
jgi:phosphohistidine phosphatase